MNTLTGVRFFYIINNLIEIGMRNFLLILNCSAIADYYTYGRALNAFRRQMLRLGNDDVLELVRISDGHICASSI